MFFQVFRLFQHISLDLLSRGSAVSDVGNWTDIWWQVVSGIFVPKIIKIC